LSDDKDGNAAVNRDNSGAGSADEQDDDEDALQFYDRSKSFFDNISCESSERAKGSVMLAAARAAVVSFMVVILVVVVNVAPSRPVDIISATMIVCFFFSGTHH